MSLKSFINYIKIKDRDKVAHQVQSEINKTRDWLREHGEWALLVGILAGIVIVLFFKALVMLIVIGGLASYLIWHLSTPVYSISNTTDIEPDINHTADEHKPE